MTTFKKVNLPFLMTKYRSSMRKFDEDLISTLNEMFLNMGAILDRGIIFGDNVDTKLVSFTSSATPDAENTVAHGLGKIPIGYIVYSQDKASDIYKGTTAWTSTNIYLKTDVASVAVKILVF